MEKLQTELPRLLPKGLKGKIFRTRLRFSSDKKKAILMKPYMFHMGKNVTLCTTNYLAEPYLISIHDNVIVAGGVMFLTHDASFWNMAHYLDMDYSCVDKVGKIELFENCFIGAASILMPNTSVGKNSIVAAGSVVTKHIPDNEVWGGIPARFMMTIETYKNRFLEKIQSYTWLPNTGLSETDIEKRRLDFFMKQSQ